MKVSHGLVADRLAKIIYGLLEGDDPEDAAKCLQDFGYTDDDGFWFYDPDEDE